MSTTAPAKVEYEVEVARDEGEKVRFAGRSIPKGESTFTVVKDKGAAFDAKLGNYRERSERAFFRAVARAAKDDKVMWVTLWRKGHDGPREVLFFRRERGV